ncbi:MAG: HAD-IA family hydrolase [Hyphomicrobiales bacterium]|nr:HAD-IA family hydrolase [Hyphomicrobiales bacterium]
MIRLCILDCDGTLVDSQHGIVAAMSEAFAANGVPGPSAADVRSVVGLSLNDAIATLLLTDDTPRIEAVAESYVENIRAMRLRNDFNEPLYPGVIDALDVLESRGWLLAVATGKSLRGAMSTLTAHNLAERFTSIQTADVAPGKPAPDMILRAIADVGGTSKDTIMIGDSGFDMLAARNAKVTAIGVGWGYQEEAALMAAGAHTVVHSAEQLPPLVELLVPGDDG